MPTQDEYNVGLQRSRNLYAKIRLVNTNWQELGEWESAVIGSPTFTIDAKSAIRRTCNISLAATDIKGIDHAVGFGKDIWLSTYFQIWLGIENLRTREVVYTNMGIYLVDNPTKVYSATDNSFTIKGVDLMSRMTGLRNGNLEGVEYVIPQGTNVRTAIIGTIALAGFKDYVVNECQFDVPNEIKIDVGSTVYDILSKLLEIDPTMQMYFDVNGVFHYEPIPIGKDEEVVINDTYWKNSLISMNTSYDFESVKNVIEVIGKTHDIKWFAEGAINGHTYELSIPAYTDTIYRNDIKIGFVAPSAVTNPMLKINSLASLPILDYNDNPVVLDDKENVYYVVRYIHDTTPLGDHFLFLGHLCPRAIVSENNPESPFSTERLGNVRIVLSGGEYENIFTDAQAQKRAEWELYNRCKLTDSINITCVPILWADVNMLFEITIPSTNRDLEDEVCQYIITSVNTTFSVDGTQTINARRYYPYYQD
jgi:hypothetical protein